MVCVGLLVFVLFPAASEGTRKVNQLGAAAVKAGIKPCGPKRGDRPCCGDGKCDAPEDEIMCMADCPGVQTTEMCGEEPHSDRNGKGLTFGVSHRAKSAQDCCDKCSASTRGCNSWTFCGYPVCFGLDTGWNHTYGECWLRKLEDPTKPTFGQRGEYTMRYRRKMLRTRRSCTDIDTPGGMSPGWVCPPTHVYAAAPASPCLVRVRARAPRPGSRATASAAIAIAHAPPPFRATTGRGRRARSASGPT